MNKSKKSLILFFILLTGVLLTLLIVKNLKTVVNETVLVTGFDYNKNNDLDSIIINKNNQSFSIKFPPHLAKSVYKIAKKDQQINVIYEKKMFDKELRLIALKDNFNQYFNLEKEHPHNHSRNNISINIKPNYVVFVKDKKGNYRAIIYEKYFLEIKGYIISELYNLLKNAKELKVEGLLREDGFINKDGYIFINVTTIYIDNKQYLIY